jgi:hypothetical protein
MLFQAVDAAGGVGAVGSPFADGQVKDLQRCLLRGEVPAPADRDAEPGVQGLDPVGGVDQASDLGGKSRNGTNSGQARSHIATIAGYFARQVSANSSNRASAAGTVAEA